MRIFRVLVLETFSKTKKSQLLSGYKKLIERYLQECPGEIKDDNHTKRLNKVMLNVKSAVAELNEKQGN